jgi:hypothetical protein
VLTGSGDYSAAPTIIDQRINRFLQHPLLIAHDDVGRAKLEQPLETVIAIDDSTVQVVEI